MSFVSILFTFFLLSNYVYAGDFNVWRNNDFDIRFTYPKNWKSSTPIERRTLHVVNWTAKKSGGLIATCYVQAAKSSVGKLAPEGIHRHHIDIKKSIMENTKKRDPRAILIKSNTSFQDNHPVVYVERIMAANNVEFSSILHIYSIVTAWRGNEIVFECASPVVEEYPETKDAVEKQIFRILRSLQFVRK